MKKEQKVLFENHSSTIQDYLEKGWYVVNMVTTVDNTGSVCFLLEREISDTKTSEPLKKRNETLERQVALLADAITRICDWDKHTSGNSTPQSIAYETIKLL
jgi:hypothetical protein